MFNSDTFANRPAFGIVGRIFISIDTAAIYRDTGSAWDLIADGGSSSTNIYNSNGTLTGNRVLSDGGFGLSFTPTTHIGTAAIGGGGNGKLIVGSSTADNGIQVFGANAPSIRIDNAQSGGTQRFVIGLATATNNFIQGATAGQFCITTASAAPLLFGMWQTINASEVMRISTANNLLIGSSVDGGQRLQVSGGARATGYYLDGMTAGAGALYWGSATNRVTLANYNAGGIINFEVNGGSSAATIDASGNFGLNVIPESWFNGYKFLQINNFSISTFLNNSVYLGLNYYTNTSGNDLYRNNGFATNYAQFSGQHAWYIAPSGTAGNPITFTQAMTLTSGGKLGLATTTPQSNFVVGVTADTQGCEIDNATSGVPRIFAYNRNGGLSLPLALQSVGGNLLVGTTTDAGQKLQVNGSSIITNTGTGPFSSQLSLKNTTSTASLITFENTVNGFTIGFSGTGTQRFVFINGSVAEVANINSTTGIYTPLSDRNKKKNFEDSYLGLDAILKLKPTLYNFITQNDSEPKQLGLIAQDVKEVIEQAYVECDGFIGINYNPIISTLINAIKELNTKIQNLK